MCPWKLSGCKFPNTAISDFVIRSQLMSIISVSTLVLTLKSGQNLPTFWTSCCQIWKSKFVLTWIMVLEEFLNTYLIICPNGREYKTGINCPYNLMHLSHLTFNFRKRNGLVGFSQKERNTLMIFTNHQEDGRCCEMHTLILTEFGLYDLLACKSCGKKDPCRD